jgi:3-hydroxyacyl-[acyl-carrier-protein] dehydratase
MRLESFQLIDRIIGIDLKSRKIEAQATVPTTSIIFDGHFPSHPLMPGVLLLEAMAQTSGWLIIGLTKFTRMPFLAAFKEAKLRSFVKPGATLSLSATTAHEGLAFAATKAEIRIEGRLACNAEITFRLLDFPSPEFLAHMESVAQTIGFPREVLADG